MTSATVTIIGIAAVVVLLGACIGVAMLVLSSRHAEREHREYLAHLTRELEERAANPLRAHGGRDVH
jgi:flagellar basal body-associated protein FliL